MHDDEFRRLKKENGDLKLEVARLSHGLKQQGDDATKHIVAIYKQIEKICNHGERVEQRIVDRLSALERQFEVLKKERRTKKPRVMISSTSGTA